MGWRGKGSGPWPGRGPFSYLPPWQRPGWLYGRGACWRFYPYLQTTIPQVPTIPSVPTPTKEQEMEMLEQQLKALEAWMDVIRKRLEELKKEE